MYKRDLISVPFMDSNRRPIVASDPISLIDQLSARLHSCGWMSETAAAAYCNH
jgi:hypothetical protein